MPYNDLISEASMTIKKIKQLSPGDVVIYNGTKRMAAKSDNGDIELLYLDKNGFSHKHSNASFGSKSSLKVEFLYNQTDTNAKSGTNINS